MTKTWLHQHADAYALHVQNFITRIIWSTKWIQRVKKVVNQIDPRQTEPCEEHWINEGSRLRHLFCQDILRFVSSSIVTVVVIDVSGSVIEQIHSEKIGSVLC